MSWLNTKSLMEPVEDFLKHLSDLQSFGRYMETVPMYPVFQIVHCTLISLALRSRPDSYNFAKRHPLSSWFVNVVSSFGGSILQNFLLAQPMLLVLKDERHIIIATIIWYLVFFSPFDVVWKFIHLSLVKALLRVLKEVHRLRMIQSGLLLASTLHPGSWLIIIVTGALRGSGAKFIMKPLDHMVRGELISSNELLAPHFATKSAMIMSALFYHEAFDYFNISKQVFSVYIFVYMVIFQLAFLFTNARDPYLYVEDLVCYLFTNQPKEVMASHSSNKQKTKKE